MGTGRAERQLMLRLMQAPTEPRAPWQLCFWPHRQESDRELFWHPWGTGHVTSIPSPGDRLLQVDGVSLSGLTHKQAVQYLKGPGQVSTPLLGTFSYFQSFPEVTVASRWERGSQETKQDFFSLLFSFLTLHLHTIFL